MSKQRDILISGNIPLSGSSCFETSHRDTAMALMCLGYPFYRVDVEDGRTLIFVFDEDTTAVSRADLMTGNTVKILVNIIKVWAAEKTWNMVYSVFKDRYGRVHA